jgi:hypothetical protein
MPEIIQYQEPQQPTSSVTGNGSGLESPNRTNQLAAGGPRTEAAKMRSSKNALKFGIFSRATLLKSESRSKYQSLLEGLWATFQPEGKLEELLVEKLGTNVWRYRRLLISECAEIRKTTELPPIEFPSTDVDVREYIKSLGTSSLTESMISRISDPDVFERCIEMLSELMQQIKENGFSEENDMFVLEKIYGETDENNTRRTLKDKWSACYATACVTEEERTREGYATPEMCKQRILRAISAEIKQLRRDRVNRDLIASKRRMVECLRQSVPDTPGLDRLLRYESSLERSFDRTLNQLERLQRIRRGQPLPPRLDVKITEG